MLDRFKIKRQQRWITRQDRRYLEARVRHFLHGYLSASDPDKDRYLEVVAAVAAGCQPENVISFSENLQVAELTAATAGAVAMRRMGVEKGRPEDHAYAFMTDACAAVAIAYRRSAGIYVDNEPMRKLGTAAVHLVTMATSHKMAESRWEEEAPEVGSQDVDGSTAEQSCENG